MRGNKNMKTALLIPNMNLWENGKVIVNLSTGRPSPECSIFTPQSVRRGQTSDGLNRKNRSVSIPSKIFGGVGGEIDLQFILIKYELFLERKIVRKSRT